MQSMMQNQFCREEKYLTDFTFSSCRISIEPPLNHNQIQVLDYVEGFFDENFKW